jgi:ATP-dependent DNA ligase
MRPTSAAAIPTSAPGGLLIQGKVDGWRALVFVGQDGKVEIQTRSGRIETRRFPELLPVLSAALPPGTILDGEIIAVRHGEPDFHALSRTPATRRAMGAALVYVAFDQLCKRGEDIRALPLARRWANLRLTLRKAGVAGLGPAATPSRPGQIQLVPFTRDPAVAARWVAGNSPIIEGIVIKSLVSVYRPSTTAWKKIRSSETVDADLVGALGPAGGPQALRVRLDGGREITTLNLTHSQLRALADDLEGRTEPGPPRVEIRLGVGRHGQARFVRMRPGE